MPSFRNCTVHLAYWLSFRWYDSLQQAKQAWMQHPAWQAVCVKKVSPSKTTSNFSYPCDWRLCDRACLSTVWSVTQNARDLAMLTEFMKDTFYVSGQTPSLKLPQLNPITAIKWMVLSVFNSSKSSFWATAALTVEAVDQAEQADVQKN